MSDKSKHDEPLAKPDQYLKPVHIVFKPDATPKELADAIRQLVEKHGSKVEGCIAKRFSLEKSLNVNRSIRSGSIF